MSVCNYQLTRWDKHFLRLAREWATMSKDPRTKCGTVFAHGKNEIAAGFNGFPECIPDNPEWYADRDLKLKLVIHSELNARNKVKDKDLLVGATCYNWPLAACGECAKHLASWGIKKIIAPYNPERIEFYEQSALVFNHCDPVIEYYWILNVEEQLRREND